MAREKKSLRVNNRQMGKGFFVCVLYTVAVTSWYIVYILYYY